MVFWVDMGNEELEKVSILFLGNLDHEGKKRRTMSRGFRMERRFSILKWEQCGGRRAGWDKLQEEP